MICDPYGILKGLRYTATLVGSLLKSTESKFVFLTPNRRCTLNPPTGLGSRTSFL